MSIWAILACTAAAISGLGGALTLASLAAVWRFARRSRLATPTTALMPGPVTLLKPLCGAEPLLEDALASFCRQDHPALQIVFGVQDPDDPAIAVVRRLQGRFSELDITLVIDATPHGMNRKVANLINMAPAARHDILVLADSDLHVAPDYVRSVLAALARPGVGLVTTVYVGRPVVRGLAACLAALHLTHSFLPGALLSRQLGRQDCLGSTMALRRSTLDRVGGLPALSSHLADDNVLGRLVRGLGLSVALADTIPVTAVQDRSLSELWSHELRWARTISALAPLAYAASSLQFPLAWALLAVLLSGAQQWSLAVFVGMWAIRASAVLGVDRLLRSHVGPGQAGGWCWLLPLRDALSLAEICCSFLGHRVIWKGQIMHADDGRLQPARS